MIDQGRLHIEWQQNAVVEGSRRNRHHLPRRRPSNRVEVGHRPVFPGCPAAAAGNLISWMSWKSGTWPWFETYSSARPLSLMCLASSSWLAMCYGISTDGALECSIHHHSRILSFPKLTANNREVEQQAGHLAIPVHGSPISCMAFGLKGRNKIFKSNDASKLMEE